LVVPVLVLVGISIQSASSDFFLKERNKIYLQESRFVLFLVPTVTNKFLGSFCLFSYQHTSVATLDAIRCLFLMATWRIDVMFVLHRKLALFSTQAFQVLSRLDAKYHH